MLPREQGGVVDANLRVYGLANVRVADASVPPIALSTHLMASTYGIAEQAANIIRAFYDKTSVSSAASSGASSSGATAVKSSSKSSDGPGNASLLHGWISVTTMVAVHLIGAFQLFP